ncbi:MAG: diguanylate cyclase, partial [Pseudomonadota bacterium]
MAIGKLKNKRFNVRCARGRFGYSNQQQPNTTLLNSGEKRFMELMNASYQGIIVHSFDWKPLFVNKAYAGTLGYLPQDILNWQSIQLLYPYDEILRLKGYLNSRVNKFSKQIAPSVYEVQVKHKQGHPVILQHTVSVTSWEGYPAALISATDVTEKYMSRQALALSEERFRDFAESASDWCWEADEHFRFTFMSDSFERIAGVPKSAIIGKTRREFFDKNLPTNYKLSPSEQTEWDKHINDLKNHLPFSHFEYNWFGRNGELLVLSASGKPVFDEAGEFRGYRGTARNITDEKMLSEKLSFQASHDELTGLLNRRYFDEALNKAIEEAQESKSEHVLVYLDLDRFKIVNDTCGHGAGDALLQQLSHIFSSIFSKRDVLARLGGDEFAVIMRNCTVNQSMRTTQQLHQKIDDFRFVWNGRSFTIGISAGVAIIDQSSDNASRLLQNVDAACYMAKELGRNKTHIFSENDDDLSRRQSEMQWAARITDVLPNDDFTLFVQPIVPMSGAQGVFYELLLRMNDGENFILPTVFLSAAERYDLSMNIDYWVLRKALFWLGSNPKLL